MNPEGAREAAVAKREAMEIERMEDGLPLTKQIDAAISAGRGLSHDPSPFGRWLSAQRARRDRVGALARVALKDPNWPQDADRSTLRSYFEEMGARKFVLASLKQAHDEFDAAQRKGKNRRRNKAARAARRRNRH